MMQAAQATDEEVIVTLTLVFKPGAMQSVLERMVPIVQVTREEPGNIEFQLFKARDVEDTLVLLERWTNQAALDWHFEQPYTKEVLALFDEHLAAPLSGSGAVTYLTDAMPKD